MKNHRLRGLSCLSGIPPQAGKLKITQMIFLFSVFCFLASLIGCEAFVRKFTRKSKKTEIKELPVLVPQEYLLADIPIEKRYRQYFLFWKTWQDELIAALNPTASHKRRKDCIKQAISNLEEVRPFLFEEKQKELDFYFKKLYSLEKKIKQDIYGRKLAIHKNRAESLKRNILRDFSYPNVKNHLR